MDGKRYSPAQLAHMSGVSVRTLHHYDQIGLLVPERRANGYRSYSSADAERLQQILILKRCGVELADIGRILDSPAFDARTALRAHLGELRRRRDGLDALIATVEQTIDHLEKGTAMADEQRFGGNQHPADRLFHNLLHGYTGPECGYRRNHLHGQKAGGRRHGSPRGHPDRQDADPLEERASL